MKLLVGPLISRPVDAMSREKRDHLETKDLGYRLVEMLSSVCVCQDVSLCSSNFENFDHVNFYIQANLTRSLSFCDIHLD